MFVTLCKAGNDPRIRRNLLVNLLRDMTEHVSVWLVGICMVAASINNNAAHSSPRQDFTKKIVALSSWRSFLLFSLFRALLVPVHLASLLLDSVPLRVHPL